jgi:hypothetical protein
MKLQNVATAAGPAASSRSTWLASLVGSQKSSLSWKATMDAAARSRPRFRARAPPPLVGASITLRRASSIRDSRATVSSVDASSTTRTSKSWNVCCSTLRTAASIVSARL